VVSPTGAAASTAEPLAEGETAGFTVTVTDAIGTIRVFDAGRITVQAKFEAIQTADNEFELSINPLVPDAENVAIPIVIGSVSDIYTRTKAQWEGGPVNLIAPNISGTAEVGQTLTLDGAGSWTTPTGTLNFTRQWEANGAGIIDDTATTVVVPAAAAGTEVTCEVTADDGTNTPVAVDSNAISIPDSGVNEFTNYSPVPGLGIVATHTGTGVSVTQIPGLGLKLEATNA
jgi:hypothetical protein